MNSKHTDYLKYWRVVRAYYKKQHGLSSAEFDMLLFLYSEGYFTKKDFAVFNKILPWNKRRFNDLVTKGFIANFRKRGGSRPGLYMVTRKTKSVFSNMYAVLNGELPMSESQANNPMFRKSSGYNQRKYQELIIKMNKATRLRRHPKDELSSPDSPQSPS